MIQTERKRALVTGTSGQDGSYLLELLLAKGYEVHGMIRRASLFNTERIDHLYQDPHDEGARFFGHYGDMTDSSVLARLVEKIKPDEVYNLAAQSHVLVSFDLPDYTADTTAMGALRLLDALPPAVVRNDEGPFLWFSFNNHRTAPTFASQRMEGLGAFWDGAVIRM